MVVVIVVVVQCFWVVEGIEIRQLPSTYSKGIVRDSINSMDERDRRRSRRRKKRGKNRGHVCQHGTEVKRVLATVGHEG